MRHSVVDCQLRAAVNPLQHGPQRFSELSDASVLFANNDAMFTFIVERMLFSKEKKNQGKTNGTVPDSY